MFLREINVVFSEKYNVHQRMPFVVIQIYVEEENQSLPMFQSLADLGHDFKKLQLVRKASNH